MPGCFVFALVEFGGEAVENVGGWEVYKGVDFLFEVCFDGGVDTFRLSENSLGRIFDSLMVAPEMLKGTSEIGVNLAWREMVNLQGFCSFLMPLFSLS